MFQHCKFLISTIANKRLYNYNLMKNICRSLSKTRSHSSSIPISTKCIILSSISFLSIFKLKKPDEKACKDEIVWTLKRAKKAENDGNFEKARDLYHKALHEIAVDEESGIRNERQIAEARLTAYCFMANMEFNAKNYETSEKLFIQTIMLYNYLGKEIKDLGFLEMSLKLAMIYSLTNQSRKAESGYEYCISELRQRITNNLEYDEDEQALLGITLESYSRYLIDKKLFNRAREILEESLSIAKRVFGENHQQIASLSNDLGTIECRTNNFDQAKVYCQTASNISSKLENQEYETCLYQLNLAEIFYQNKEIEEAIKYIGIVNKTATLNKFEDLLERAQILYKDLKKINITLNSTVKT